MSGLAACGRPSAPPVAPSLPQTSGTLVVGGLDEPVTVVRDRWGIPHIYASSARDLFYAQGFVQAQDRIFQMDLWRRSVQGRLSEVLGANFVERDAMTRRVQYRGDMDAEWESYGPDARAIAEAFVGGINAWIDVAERNLPEEFTLAGWKPERWTVNDLTNRTDGFVASAGASLEVFRARLIAAVGARRADALFPPSAGLHTAIPRGVDVATISYVLAEALQRVGTAPVFSGFAAPFGALGVAPDVEAMTQRATREAGTGIGSNAWAVGSERSSTGLPILAVDPHRSLLIPSLRYLVHLKAPGWNVIGATAPWLPGVAIGHNDRLAWGMTSLAADVQDLFVEEVNPVNPHGVRSAGGWVTTTVVDDPIVIKGRQKAFAFEREYTPHGVVIASDRERGNVFTLRWTGFESGAAAELAALGLDRAESEGELRAALKRWKLPAATVVYADAEGRVGSVPAGSVPMRRSWNGELPASGWTGAYEWQGVRALSDVPRAVREVRPAAGAVVSTSDSLSRKGRLDELLGERQRFDVDDFKRMQHDTLAWNAQQIVHLLAPLPKGHPEVEDLRRILQEWDRRLTVESTAATLYVMWEREIVRRLAEAAVPSLRDEVARRLRSSLVLVLADPSTAWFGREPGRGRDRLLLDALTTVAETTAGGRPPSPQRWGRLHAALFSHPLGITAASRARFNIGPFDQAGYAETVMSTSGLDLETAIGAPFRAIFDVGNWDRSVVVNAPGQSEAWRSSHYADLAKVWSTGDYVPLVFSEPAVQANREATLVLAPGRTR